MKSRHVRVYSALLRLYPRQFRAEYRREMTLLFAQQLEDIRSTQGRLGVLRLWTRSLFDLVATAPTEHLENDVLVAQPVVGIDQSRTKPERALRIAWMIAALAPAFMVLFFWAFAPHFMDPMFEKPPEAFGFSSGTRSASPWSESDHGRDCAFWRSLSSSSPRRLRSSSGLG